MESSKAQETIERRLDSWKEIASYLDRGVRTVQRWERTEGLPVRRHQHDKRGTVFALASEIDRWQREREASGQTTNPDAESLPSPSRRRALAAAVVAMALGALAAGYSLRPAGSPAEEWSIRPVTSDHGHEHSPAISSDGSQIAYVWHEDHADPTHIYIQARDGSNRRRLASGDQYEYSPAWSPDDKSIAAAFLYPDEDRRSIVLITPETGACRTLIEPAMGLGNPVLAWSPDGAWLVLSVALDERGPGLFAYRVADGATHELLAPEGQAFAWGPAVSPDGRSLAFVRMTSNSVSELFTLELDQDFRAAGDPEPVTAGGGSVSSPMWSADGREILYRGGWWADSGLWRVDSQGGEPRRAAVAARGLSEVTLNAQERLLVFSHETGAADLWLQPQCDCPDRARRFVSSTLHDFNARLSPDGERLVWISDRTGRFQVWVSSSDGADPSALTQFGDTMTGTPRWSPDSRLIVFDSRPDGNSDVFVIPADGGDPQQFTESPSADLTPTFSSDGQSIYFGSDRSGRFEIWKKPLAGGEASQITQDGGFTAAEAFDGKTLFFALNGDKSGRGTSLWRMPVEGGQAVEIAENIADWSKFVVREQGVYFLACDGEDRDFCDVRIYESRSGDTRTLARVPRDIELGFDVAPDGSLLYARYEPAPGDLMLVENFY